MANDQLSSRQIASLKASHRTLKDRKEADRVKVVVFLGSGWSVSTVAEAIMLDVNTVRSYFDKYVHGGEEELLEFHYVGRQPMLTAKQEKALSRHLDANVYLSSSEIRHYIKKTFGVAFQPSGVKALLHRLDFVYKKTKHLPGKLDTQAQQEFIEHYEQLKKTKGKNDPIYFSDAVHPQYNSVPSYGWIRRGKDKELRSNVGRKRVNINGAVNINSLEITTDFSKTINDRSALRLFWKLEKNILTLGRFT
ncbi:MAG: IS630 family transposase [Planctomycetaceae bacterium]|jgi:transposase|nr:IS630 family transposase [Planctomycetaceae bacterium]